LKIIFPLLIVILFVSGCASIGNLGDLFKNFPGITSGGSGGGKSFVGGTNSVTVNILQPPEAGKVAKDVPLRVSVNLKNDGEAQADGQVCVTGLDSAAFPLSESCSCKDFSLKGKVRLVDETTDIQEDTKTFDEGTPTLGEFTINAFSVTSIVRYDYKTYATVEGCVRKDLLKSKDCKPQQDAKLVGVSSAPMQVTSVSQELISTGDEEYTMTLIIEIAHKGKGQFYDTSLEKDSCSDDGSNINKKVGVKLYNAPGSATCSSMVIKKNEDKGTATCTITGIAARDFKPLMNLELSYAYEMRESNNFEVA
jgi:hypothetical protein